MTVVDDRFTEPLLTIPETSRHLVIPRSTMYYWTDPAHPVIHVVPPRPDHARVPFMAAVEAQLLRGFREQLGISLPEIRDSIARFRRELGNEWALVQRDFATDGKNLLVNILAESAGPEWERAKDGQLGMPTVIEQNLKYLEFGPDGLATRLTLRSYDTEGTEVILDPRFGYGEPVFRSSMVRVRDVTDAFYAGEDPEDIADDYGVRVADVWAALRVLGPRRIT